MNEFQTANLGATLRAARKSKKLSAESLGAMLEPTVKANTITSWERGERRPKYEIIGQLSRILEVDIKSFYPATENVCYEVVEFPPSEKMAEMNYFYTRMNDTQRDAVLTVARAMVEC